jgi:phospholipase C
MTCNPRHERARPACITRRTFLKGAFFLGVASLSAPLLWTAPASAAPAASSLPIRHIIVDCQENRSFDHYYGYAPWSACMAFL